ncbi:MAG TPA: hypothetical protein VMS65_16575, partial [Polyangiaceae bacterium]|nr:hypothetical protein [Polyangiaceae bacterium]
HREVVRMAHARWVMVFALGLGVGCGRSIRHETDGEDTGGSSGSSGESTGGSGATTGGFGGASGSSGGAVQGGSSGSGAAGAGGESNDSGRLFYQSSGALVSTDLDGADFVELCPPTESWTKYHLVGVDGETVIVYRQRVVNSLEGDIVRVTLDGSTCQTIFSESLALPLSPIVDGRVVFVVAPVAAAQELELPAPPQPITVRPTGLASIGTDGEGYALFAPSGVLSSQIVGDRVVFTQVTAGIPELYSALPDTTGRETLLPDAGNRWVAAATGRRMVVNAQGGDVYAVDDDGGRPLPLSIGPDSDIAEGFAGDWVVLLRSKGTAELPQTDLYAVPLAGGEPVPLATTTEFEGLLGSRGDRVVFARGAEAAYGEILSVRLDGSDTEPIAPLSEGGGEFMGLGDSRVVFIRAMPTRTTYFSANLDGSDSVTLLENATRLAAIVGDRVIFYLGGSQDLVSVPITGGEAVPLADAQAQDWLVGRLGETVIVRSADLETEGEIFRIATDGSSRRVLLPSARYVGAITEACGAVPEGELGLSACR